MIFVISFSDSLCQEEISTSGEGDKRLRFIFREGFISKAISEKKYHILLLKLILLPEYSYSLFSFISLQAKAIFERICPGEEFLPKAPNPEDIIFGDPEKDNPEDPGFASANQESSAESPTGEPGLTGEPGPTGEASSTGEAGSVDTSTVESAETSTGAGEPSPTETCTELGDSSPVELAVKVDGDGEVVKSNEKTEDTIKEQETKA